ncbi:hypothetical protein BRADI_3g58050v3, partial [Brachypodium distachyon]
MMPRGRRRLEERSRRPTAATPGRGVVAARRRPGRDRGVRPRTRCSLSGSWVRTMALLVLVFVGTGRGGSLSPSMLPGTAFVQNPAAAASPDNKPAHDQDARLLAVCCLRHSTRNHAVPGGTRPGTGQIRDGSFLSHDELRLLGVEGPVVTQYVVWTPFNGLGNRMLALASTFLYALLTGRVLLVHSPKEFGGLFCEPFPGSSWTLPAHDDFPITDFDGTFTMSSPASYKNMRQAGALNDTAERLPAYVFLDLIQSYTDAAFCEADQRVLAEFRWLVVKSDVYFAAMFFLMPACSRELARLFPEKQAVFHRLARYLFHPSSAVWGIVVRGFYKAYDFAGADERVGLQVRVFPEMPVPFDAMYGQIMRCSEQQRGLLPKVENSSVVPPGSGRKKKKKLTSILVTSLTSGYYDRIRGAYRGRGGTRGGAAAEPRGGAAHGGARRVLAEMYLLSSCDRIVTTAVSTFGYVAHGLAGTRPWVLLRPEAPAEPACVSASCGH